MNAITNAHELATLQTDDSVILLFSSGAPCSPPRYVSDDVETELHFSKYWIPNSRDSYSVIATGNSMLNAGISNGDMLVIDCSREPRSGNIVAAWLNGDLTIKQLDTENNIPILRAANPDFQSIVITDSDEFQILGVVTSLHRHLI